MKINDIDWSKVPDILAKEQVRLLCHCSKRTALYYLKSGKLPCIYSGKKTRCYKIRKEDLMAFIEDRENHPEFYAVPEGYLKLLFPNVQSEMDVDKTEFRDYCLIPAMRMRRIIKLQQGFIDTEYKGKDVPFFTVDD